jgi:iron complex transport system permease protein
VRTRAGAALGLSLAFAAAAAVVAATLGPAGLSAAESLRALVGLDASDLAREVVHRDRVPRIGLGLAVGAALAGSGTLFQGVLRNPLADPYLVGVGPGAFLGATLGAAAGLAGRGGVAGLSAVALCAFVGALASAALVLGAAGAAGRAGRLDSGRLLLCGVAIGSFVTAVATAALYLGTESWHEVAGWLLGRLSWASGARVALAGGAALSLLALAWWRARDLDALALGPDAARLVGVEPSRVVLRATVLGCLLAAAAVASAGLIGFVGLVVPHLARATAGPGHRASLPVSACLGAGLLVLSDGVARLVLEIPVGIVTALLGAPVFAWIAARGAAR